MTYRPADPVAVLLRFLAAAVAGGATGGLLVSALIVAVALPPGDLSGALGFAPELLMVLVGAGIVGAAIAIPLFGVPVMFLLRAAGAESPWAYGAAGAAGGFLLLIVLGGVELPFAGPAGAVYGAVTGAWFWFLLRRARGGGAADPA
jgi:hypothetical protein